MDRREARVVVETDRYRIEGVLTLPREGYRSRLSDYLNRADVAFLPLTDVALQPLNGGESVHHEFVAVAKRHIRIALNPPEG